MAKKKKKKTSPSRIKYEQEHPTISFRLDKETYTRLKKHLQGTGHSYADFNKDALGREESLINERVEMLASRKIDPSLEDKVRCLENLVCQLFMFAVDTDQCPPSCPHCEEELYMCEAREKEYKVMRNLVLTWKCPKCGFFLDTYNRIDPKSTKWVDPETFDLIDKPNTSSGHTSRKRKQGSKRGQG